MNVGDTIICRGPRGYWFTEGKEYTVLKYEAPFRDENSGFTWPAYVYVEDNNGKIVACHASRFVPKKELTP